MKGAVMSQPLARDYSKEEKIAGLIDQISAYIEQYHNGSVELVAINGDEVQVRLGGACLGCPLSIQTLQGWVAGTLHQFFPELEIKAVE
jgi:Fe-S cluster biogenesis protein NfuA